MLTLSDRTISIWGAGKCGIRDYFRLRNDYDIRCFYDNDIHKTGQEVTDGIYVEPYDKQKHFIIIAADSWKEISVQLQSDGLKLIRDFLPANLLFMEKVYFSDLLDTFDEQDILDYIKKVKEEKKLAIVYGNCQAEVLCNMLELNPFFFQDYIILRVPPVHLYRNQKQINNIFYGKVIKETNLFVYQHVSLENGYGQELATERLCCQVDKNCSLVRIHNIYFDGYFVQMDQYFQKKASRHMDRYYFPYADRFVHKLWMDGEKTEDIIRIIMDPWYVSSSEIMEKCNRSVCELRKREENTDVAISSYIEENYRNTQLFYTRNHPANQVLHIYVNRLLKLLGYEQNAQMDESSMYMQYGFGMKNCDWPLYPSVIQVLGMRNYEKFYYTYSWLDGRLYGFEEFFRKYINRIYGNKSR